MKIIILLSAFFIASLNANETTRFKTVNEIIDLTQIDKWIDFVKVIKSDEDIPAYLNYKKPNDRHRQILLGLNLLSFEKGLRSNLAQFVTIQELESALKLYHNPFVVKTITSVDFFEIYPVVLADVKKQMHPKLKPLIISLYNILGHEPILIEEYKSYKTTYLDRKKAAAILQDSNEVAQKVDNEALISVEQYRELYFEFLYSRVKNLSIPELREFIRVTRDNKSFLKVNQVLTSYSYGFISAQARLVDGVAKRKAQLGY